MLDRIRERGAIGAIAVIAFAAGIGLAAGVRSGAVDAPGDTSGTPLPRLQTVRPVAELSQAFIAISGAVTPAVVRIQTERPMAERRLPPSLREMYGTPPRDSVHENIPEITGGTGFVLDDEGHILTNNHVVEDADRITVTLRDKRTFEARLVGTDPTTDVAVIQVAVDGLTPARMGDSDRAEVGEWVLAVGNPGFGPTSTLDFTVTSGIISAKGRPLDILNRELLEQEDPSANYAIEDFIQTDAVINPGNSGGPLVNLRGEVIGVNTAIASGTGYYEGYGFAIPINLARRVAGDLIEYGQVRRPVLGVRIRDVGEADAQVYSLPAIGGVLVQDFTGAGSPARTAGVERGDVVVAVDGHPVDRVGQLQRLVAQHHPGEAADLTVVRYGEQKTFSVRLEEAPFAETGAADAREPREAREPQLAPGLGIRIGELAPGLARHLGFDAAGGVVVRTVQPGSAAETAGVVPGQRILAIDRHTIRSRQDAADRLGRLRSGDVVSLLLQRPEGETVIANVRVP